ncbi:carbohydrate ABC transporter permease [Bauldia litoralis]|uniref:Carbohydrate ABC transporter membrane protein 2, CUT1 family (TC 3.A.1.1.-) n=1 Tax=Bauldia litoralis TaxID=665467 RepID=A0A1G6B9H3_9HYPH|nr:carbohydrate ABC transporter permease [Bauldia litoralis]SDB17310.1 carbohydrate ABC transporter membrane protein 2, CUT1 family (TC 3.A.1.1.-) [Bauldia litoralis]
MSMRRGQRWAIARYVGLTLFAIPWVVVPIWMVVVNSFKMAGEAANLTLDLPSIWSIAENYTAVLVQGNYLRALGNSLLISGVTIFAVVLIGAAAAWGFGRSRSKAMQVAYYIIVLSILIPPTLIPTIYLLRDMHIEGSTLGYILVLIGTRMGIVVFLATGFVRALPPDMEDAAFIDGASRLQIFFLIMLPLLTPVLFVGSIILVITVWGDFFFATFLLPGSQRATLPLALYSFATSSVQSFRWNLVFAHVVLSSLPLIVAYVFLQRRIVGGLTEGALKG